MSQPSWDYIAKIVSIGDSGTGKSSLTIRLCEGRFQNHHDVTIGVEFGSRIVPVGPPASLALNVNNPVPTNASKSSGGKEYQKYMKLSLWDTAGQETYKSITRSYFRGASGALLVFDISRRQTFESATSWLNDLRQIAEDGIVVVLVGNKSDLGEEGTKRPSSPPAAPQQGSSSSSSSQPQQQTEKKREVSREEAEAWARAHNVLAYVETSAKSGEGVERAFQEVAERIFQGIEAGRYNLEDRRSGVKRAGAGGHGGSNVRVGASHTADMTARRGGCC